MVGEFGGSREREGNETKFDVRLIFFFATQKNFFFTEKPHPSPHL
jgi:hypothetical protein